MQDKQIEQYLRKSTRGLWGKKKAEVREELSAHIQGRVHAHLVAGHSEGGAVEKTLTELGHPTNVSTGMARLYTVPIVAGSGMMLAMCCALVVVLLSRSTAQTLQTSDIFPVDECLESKEATLPWYCHTSGWANIEDLKEALEPQGVTFKQTGEIWTLTFPEGAPTLVGKTDPQWTFYDEEGSKEFTLIPKSNYFRLGDLISSLRFTKLPVQLEGWEKPVLQVGNTTLTLDFPLEDAAREFYLEAMYWEVFQGIPFNNTYSDVADPRTVTTEVKRFKVSDGANTVYGLAVRMDPNEAPNVTENAEQTTVVFIDVAVSDVEGVVAFDTPTSQSFNFVESPTKIGEVGEASLVRLTGDLTNTTGYVAVPPDQIRLE